VVSLVEISFITGCIALPLH